MLNIRIGVLMGGVSSEREISLKSGRAVFDAFKTLNLETVAIDIQRADKNYVTDLLLSYDIGLAFLALHGNFGEDGKIQTILEEIDIPYTGSKPYANALALDKIASRRIFEETGLSVPKYYLLDKNRRSTKNIFGFPLAIKPLCGGSSIGLSIADNHKELKNAIDLAFKYDRKVIVEEYIRGREMTVGIFEDKPLEAIEIRPKSSRFFDYSAKYKEGQTEYIVPAELSFKTMSLLKNTALKTHNLLGCSFFSRVDIILSSGKAFVLEVNTIPGFTPTSLLPKAALQKGIGFLELILRIAQAALAKYSLDNQHKKHINSESFICQKERIKIGAAL